MKGRAIGIGFLAIFVLGFIFLRGPTPHIAIAAEPILEQGGPSHWFFNLDITNTMLTSWIIVAVLVVAVILMTRKWELVPSGAQNLIEGAAEAFYNLVTSVAGEENGRRFFPVVATIFFMVVAFNWAGLLPGFSTIGEVHEEEHGFVFEEAGPVWTTQFSSPSELSSPSIDEDDANAHEEYELAVEEGKKVGELFPFFRAPASDLNTPLALAIVSAIAVEFWGLSALGLGYLKKFFNFRSPIDFFVGFLELISELVRLVSFTFRLFGNVFAGEVVIVMFTFLTPLVITTFIFYPLEIFVGIIQAFIFAVLTLVFAVMAVAHHGDDHKEYAEDIHSESNPEGSPVAAH